MYKKGSEAAAGGALDSFPGWFPAPQAGLGPSEGLFPAGRGWRGFGMWKRVAEKS